MQILSRVAELNPVIAMMANRKTVGDALQSGKSAKVRPWRVGGVAYRGGLENRLG